MLVTRGSRGMALFEAASDGAHTDRRLDQIADVTGAGDTVIATMTSPPLPAGSFEEAARLANYAGGLVVDSAAPRRSRPTSCARRFSPMIDASWP